MAEKKISYTVRDFQVLRTELINFTRTYYPDLVQNFNDAGIFSVMLDLNAAVTDNLNYQIDRSIQETVLQFAQQKNSIYNNLHGGYDNIFPKVEEAMHGKNIGDTIELALEPVDAFGEYDAELVQIEPASAFPQENLKEGAQFEGEDENPPAQQGAVLWPVRHALL